MRTGMNKSLIFGLTLLFLLALNEVSALSGAAAIFVIQNSHRQVELERQRRMEAQNQPTPIVKVEPKKNLTYLEEIKSLENPCSKVKFYDPAHLKTIKISEKYRNYKPNVLWCIYRRENITRLYTFEYNLTWRII